jgi:hypothetical protein
MSEGGKLYEATKETAQGVGFYDKMRKLIPAIRAAHIKVIIVPHHRQREGDYNGWKHMTGPRAASPVPISTPIPGSGNPDSQLRCRNLGRRVPFRIRPAARGRQRGSRRSFSSALSRTPASNPPLTLAWSLVTHVTLVKDATAAFDREGMHAAHEVNGPRFAHAILTTEELLALLPH